MSGTIPFSARHEDIDAQLSIIEQGVGKVEQKLEMCEFAAGYILYRLHDQAVSGISDNEQGDIYDEYR